MAQKDSANSVQSVKQMKICYRRLGHVSQNKIIQMSYGLVDDLMLKNGETLGFCVSWQLGKQPRRTVFPKNTERNKVALEIVHSYVCGPMPVESVGGKRYFITFTDDFTRCTAVYFMAQKNAVLEHFREFHCEAKLAARTKIKCLCSINVTEYMNAEFQHYLKENGIRRQLSAPYCPQQK